MNDHLRVSSHQQWKLTTHIMNWFCNVRLSDLVQLIWVSPCPKFDSSVPSTWDNHRGVVLMKHIKVLNWLRMRSNIHYLVLLKVPFLNIVVSTSKKDTNLINAPYSTENWNTTCRTLQHDFRLDLISHLRRICLVYNHVSVPKTSEKKSTAELLVSLWQRSKF